ncbi:hypothetical protein PVAP13_4NG064400 [Panicum virgatum]|uniref:Uncharacterized protein n=1 Tax=Panicum virgatum TaxID=38727 RepID=A0A8T0T8Z2_PANVG|nr:hypothetical protein PVAP13_4NG064400 [Panicum virgatum]
MGARSPAHISPTRAWHGPEYYWARPGTGTIAGPCLGLTVSPWTHRAHHGERCFRGGLRRPVPGLIALEIFCFLDPQSGAGTAPSAQAPLPDADCALRLLLPLGAAAVLLTAVGFIYRRLSHATVPAADRLLSGVVNFILCVSACVLHFSFFVQPGGGAADHVAQARALGPGALHALPAAATATFFWGTMLIIVAHVRAGGEGGGGAGSEEVAPAPERGTGRSGGPRGPVRLLTNVALGEAAGLVFLVTIALGVK